MAAVQVMLSMAGNDPEPIPRAGLPPEGCAGRLDDTEAKSLIYLIVSAVVAALIVAGLAWRDRQLRRKPRLLAEIMDEADALEYELHECRARLREIPALVAALPPSDQLSARATLVAEPQVQAALRDLLSHRLWLKEHAATATLAELESARAALAGAKSALATQLERLADVRADVEQTRATAAAQPSEVPH